MKTISEINKAGSFDRHRGPVTCAVGVPGTDLVVTSGYDSAVGIVAGVVEIPAVLETHVLRAGENQRVIS